MKIRINYHHHINRQQNQMPIRQGKAKLWFSKKQQIDEYDDRMISNIELTTTDEKDPNYTIVFTRKKKESFLALTDKAKPELKKLDQIYSDPRKFITKYLQGKNDHTINRYSQIDRKAIGLIVGYFLLRELPVRNFYARCSIMIFAFGMLVERTGGSPLLWKAKTVALRDEFTDKPIRNYQCYKDLNEQVIPRSDNKISEARVWRLNQPGYLKEVPSAKISELMWNLVPPKKKQVAWDGTWNMPLAGLAHPQSKDGKHIEFTWWEY